MTIRDVHARFGVSVDPHTAAGLAVAMRVALSTPMIALETAQPAKFESTMIEALGFAPPRPVRFEGLEQRPQHVKVIDATVGAVRDEIAARC
jgi:threonine synthase